MFICLVGTFLSNIKRSLLSRECRTLLCQNHPGWKNKERGKFSFPIANKDPLKAIVAAKCCHLKRVLLNREKYSWRLVQTSIALSLFWHPFTERCQRKKSPRNWDSWNQIISFGSPYTFTYSRYIGKTQNIYFYRHAFSGLPCHLHFLKCQQTRNFR